MAGRKMKRPWTKMIYHEADLGIEPETYLLPAPGLCLTGACLRFQGRSESAWRHFILVNGLPMAVTMGVKMLIIWRVLWRSSHFRGGVLRWLHGLPRGTRAFLETGQKSHSFHPVQNSTEHQFIM